MELLSDEAIVAALAAGELVLTNFTIGANPYAKTSPVQPSSLDLTIGDIYVPAEDGTGSEMRRTGHVLASGETAVVVTRESLTLGNTLAAFGFPPTEISSQGILMTNPGHVDPGYNGPLRFTLINMGRAPFNIEYGKPIVSLLLCRLRAAAHAGYADRYGVGVSVRAPAELVKNLSPDFLDVEERARSCARAEVSKAEARLRRRQAGLPVFGVIVAAVIAAIASSLVAWRDLASKQDVRELLSRVGVLEGGTSCQALTAKVEALQAEVSSMRVAGAHAASTGIQEHRGR